MIFRKAFEKTLSYEGLYSKHAADKGGETFRGISRKFHPKWDGWEIINNIKNEIKLEDDQILIDELNIIFRTHYELLVKTEIFYYNEYWLHKHLNLDEVAKSFPNIAFQLFDMAVNMGVSTSAKIFQRCINILNREGKDYPNLVIDGIIGEKTIRILNTELLDEKQYLYKLIILMRAKIYIDMVEGNESQEVFIRGWLNRVSFN